MKQTWEDEGGQWLADLPALIEMYAARWSLKVHEHFPELSYNYVAPVTRADGSEAVLKLGLPRHELRREIAALRVYDGRGSARLLEADVEGGALLIERLMPGLLLVEVEDDEQATRIAAGVMGMLWRPAPTDSSFPGVEKWIAGLGRLRARYDGGTGPLPADLVRLAERLFADLLASMGERVLLHGDLHHYNILAAGRAPWLAIDPKGVTGEREFDAGTLLHNPLDVAYWPDLAQKQARRIDILAEMLGFDRQRLVAWGIAQAVLSAWWVIEDNGTEWEGRIRVAEGLVPLLE